MKISIKLILGFAVMIAIMVFMILLAKNSMTEINGKVEELAKDRFPKTVEANNIINQINLQARAVRNIIIFADSETTSKELDRVMKSRESIAASLNKLRETVKSDAGKEKLANVENARKNYLPVMDKVIESAKAGDYEAAKGNLITTLRKVQQKYFDEVEALLKFQYDLIDKSTVTAAETFESSVTMLYITIFSGVILAVLVGLWIILSITKPLNRAVKAADSIASGDLGIDLKTNSKDETGLLLNSMERMTGSIKELMGETNALIDSVNNGKLDIRGNADKYKGSWSDLVGSVNSLVDSFVAPINVTAEYVDRISKGDIPPKITDTYKGDFNEIKNNINACIDVMSSLLTDTNILIESTKAGKLDARADSRKYIGGWNRLVSGINELINEFVGPINVTAEYVDRISKGDIPPKITDEYKGDFNEIKNNLNACIDVMSGLLSETTLLIDSATAGKLDIRANNMKFTGGWNTLVKSINELIDAFVKPINVTAEYIDRISKGDIPMKITDEYKGDFNEIKNNINLCIDSVNRLVKDAQNIAEEAINGRLRSRADETRHNGDFRAIIKGFNNSLDSIVGLLNNLPIPVMGIDKEFSILYMNEFAASLDGKSGEQMTGKKCYDHFKTSHCKTDNCACNSAMRENRKVTNEVDAHPGGLNLEISYSGMPILDKSGNVIGAFEVVSDLTDVKKSLKEAQAAMDDANKARTDAQATMNTIVKINQYQDCETGELVKALEKLSEGDLNVEIAFNSPDEDTKECYAVLMKIVSAVNKFKGAVIALQEDAFKLADYAKEGLLDKRADVSRHNGDFKNVVLGMNDMLDKLLDPINEGAKALEIMATGDLTARVTGDYKGGHAKIKESINSVGDSLSTLINQVMGMTQSVSSIALQMSSTAETMAAGSQEQAAQADDVSSAVEEMSRTITENAMSAHKTVEEAEKNKNIANDGGTIVQQTVQKMKDIANVVSQSAQNMEKLGDSSTQIGEIISVIDDIADQTNLLALNAAIEAARAGEQGRGFAVVADEVRKLAERTTEATKQIADMIKGIQLETQNAVKVMNIGNQEVTNGIQLADKAGKSLQEIVLSSQDVQMMINQIAAASEEQSSTSEEIAKNVQSINQVTNESAKRIQDIAESSDNLARMIETLNNLLNQFKVEDTAGTNGRGTLHHSGNGNGHSNGNGNIRKQTMQLAGRQAYAEVH